MGIITGGEKIGKREQFVEIDYVNPGCISTAPFPCGKVLWKNMWRMWKSVSFQQLFRSPEKGGSAVENCVYPVAYGMEIRLRIFVTSMEVSVIWRGKIHEIVEKDGHCDCQNPGRRRMTADFL